MARPKKKIDQKQFEQLCKLQCTQEEICGFFDVTDKTLTRWCKETYNNMSFSEIFKIKSQSGKISLRRWQFKAAEKGNSSMLIWLGKQHLNQTDKVDSLKVEIGDDGFIEALKGTAKNDWE